MLEKVTGVASSTASSQAGSLCDEIKAGGIEGCIGWDQVDWGEATGGKTFEFWPLSPCCGTPCDSKTACYCMAMWLCCNVCSASKLCATSLDQPCSIWPHFMCVALCAPLSIIALRYNVRKKVGIEGTIIGDCLCMYFCGPFACCQMLRAVAPSDWDAFGAEVVAPTVKFLR